MCAQGSPTKSTDSDQPLEALLQEASAAVLVRGCYSYEVGINDLNWLLFKTAASRLGTWGETAFEFSKDITFRTDLSIATSHVGLLATTLGNNASRARREGPIDAIAYCLLLGYRGLHYAMWTRPGGDQLVQLLSSPMVVSSLVSFCRTNMLLKRRRYSVSWLTSY